MSNSATSQVTFEAWCARLHPSPHIAPDHQRSSIPSFDVNNCVVPVSIHQWYEFPSFVTAWKAEMYSRGLGESTTFAKFAGLATQYYTTGGLLSSVIRCDEHTRYYLGEFYKMVNYFNLDYHQILAPDQQPPHPSTEIYADPIVALGVISNPDTLITNGETEMNKRFRLHGSFAILNFGEDFVAPQYQNPELLLLAQSLAQLYSGMITDGLSIGFLATSDSITYCFIPPENRTCLKIFSQRILRAECPWEMGPQLFTVQGGLATLAWIAKRQYSNMYPRPEGDFSITPNDAREQQDPPCGVHWPRRGPLPPNAPATHSGHPFCTSACLLALIKNTTDLNCPNFSRHPPNPNTDIVIDEASYELRYDQIDLLGGGNHSKTLSIRTPTGYTLAVKAYNEATRPDPDYPVRDPFYNELEIYHHLRNLQGVCVPVVLCGDEAIFAGTMRHVIFMSFEGVSAARCELTNSLLDGIERAFAAIHAECVHHDDATLANVLINGDTVSVIDFESARICDEGAPLLEGEQEVVERACERVRRSGDNSRFLNAYESDLLDPYL